MRCGRTGINTGFNPGGAEFAEVSFVCRSGFSREHRQFAAKAAPTNTCKFLCELCASAVNI